MKKVLLAIATVCFIPTGNVMAEDDDNIFNHLSVGIGVGTTGIEFQVAAPITNHFAVRTGYSFMPKISPKFDVDFDSNDDWLANDPATGKKITSADIKGELNMGDFRLLADYYPSATGSFHITAGFFIGRGTLVKAYNTSPVVSDEKNSLGEYKYWGSSGPELGKAPWDIYTVVSDNNGNIKADVKVNSFKPYLGIGVGRAVPTNRLNVSFDFGVQFWGKPSLWTTMKDAYSTEGDYQKVDRKKIINDEDYCDDIKDGLKIAEKIFVYPVLTVRLNGKIF